MDARLRALMSVLAADGETGRLAASLDWSATPLGPPEQWPASLVTALGIAYSSPLPMLVGWGPDLVQLYNDAFRPILGVGKHPAALGRRWQQNWAEIWDLVGPMLEGVLQDGTSTRSDDQQLLIERSGWLEEGYFTFSFSPVWGEDGRPAGVFCAAIETTRRVIGERRSAALGRLARSGTEARSVEQVVSSAVSVLADDPADVPWALVHLLSAHGSRARLAGSTGAPEAAETVVLGSPEDTWDLAGVLAAEKPLQVSEALVSPLVDPALGRPVGFLVTGLSGLLPHDEDYLGFLDQVAGHLSSSLAAVRAHQAERARAEALAALDEAKTEFFSNVSHEFRTPLTLLLGPLAEVLGDETEGLGPQQRQRLDTVTRNAQRLLKLVNTLLDVSRVEAGRTEASFEPVDLGPLTAELVSGFDSAVRSAGLVLEVDCPSLPDDVYVDRDLWEKVVLNLVGNALKYTFEGTISVALHQADESVQLHVTDTGTGIPAEDLPHVFERFHRVRGAVGRTHEGSGIGLALVRDLAALHGGSVDVASSPGAGSTFTVTLPTGSRHLPPDRIGAARAAAATRLPTSAFVAESLHLAPEDPPAADPVEPAVRLLVADDNADMRAYLHRLLSPHWSVELVPDGTAALASALAHPPDLVLTDVMMPGLDGLGLLRALRAAPLTAAVPVVLLSARAGDEATEDALAAGADDYLVKPFTPRQLIARVRVHLSLARSRAAVAAADRRTAQETAARRAAESLRAAEDRFRHAFDDAPVGMAILDGALGVQRANPALCRLLGQSAAALESLSVVSLVHPDDRKLAVRSLTRLAQAETPSLTWEVCVLRADGSPVPVTLAASSSRAGGELRQILVHVLDVTERRHFEGQLQYLADHDPLTGLLNRRRLMEELDREVSAVHRYGGTGALLLLDLDDFKYVNDSLGHAAGDELIVRTTAQLTQRLRESDTLARLGGDEFAVILPHVDEVQAREVALDLLQTLHGGGAIVSATGARRLTASIGIAVFDARRDTAPSSEELLVEADTAMYDAKEAGRAQVAVFDPDNVRQVGMEMRLDAAERLREALDSERLVLHAQPIVALHVADVPHYELLVRIRTEDGTLIPPTGFLEVAERFQLVRAIDRWVVSEALRLLTEVQAQGRRVRLSVNLSVQSILDPELPGWIAASIGALGIDGSALVFEVTETDAAVNFERANQLTRRLAELGCGFALDDFGTGYCSLRYLKHLSFDYLKIDAEFVRNLLTSAPDQIIVRAAVDIARGLGKQTVAEGVEDQLTLDLLTSYGVDFVQGFHLAEPAPAHEVLGCAPPSSGTLRPRDAERPRLGSRGRQDAVRD